MADTFKSCQPTARALVRGGFGGIPSRLYWLRSRLTAAVTLTSGAWVKSGTLTGNVAVRNAGTGLERPTTTDSTSAQLLAASTTLTKGRCPTRVRVAAGFAGILGGLP
jgi:hypothetical protein